MNIDPPTFDQKLPVLKCNFPYNKSYCLYQNFLLIYQNMHYSKIYLMMYSSFNLDDIRGFKLFLLRDFLSSPSVRLVPVGLDRNMDG